MIDIKASKAKYISRGVDQENFTYVTWKSIKNWAQEDKKDTGD